MQPLCSGTQQAQLVRSWIQMDTVTAASSQVKLRNLGTVDPTIPFPATVTERDLDTFSAT